MSILWLIDNLVINIRLKFYFFFFWKRVVYLLFIKLDEVWVDRYIYIWKNWLFFLCNVLIGMIMWWNMYFGLIYINEGIIRLGDVDMIYEYFYLYY